MNSVDNGDDKESLISWEIRVDDIVLQKGAGRNKKKEKVKVKKYENIKCRVSIKLFVQAYTVARTSLGFYKVYFWCHLVVLKLINLIS